MQFIRKLKARYYDVLLIDKVNHHQFQPLFYQVATSQLEPSSISFPFRKIFQNNSHVRIRMVEVLSIDAERNCVLSSEGEFTYDILVIATGCKSNYFGNTGIETHSFGLKSTFDAIRIRNHILRTFEKIITAPPADLEALYNIVIVGGGPTGVELSGAFAEIKSHILPKDYPGIDFSKLNISLIEGSPNTLNAMSENAREASSRYLRDMGVEIRTNTQVQGYDGLHVTLSTGESIPSKNLIWAAGVTGNFIPGLDEGVKAPGNRMKVDRNSRVQGYSNIYALGDISSMETPKYPKGHPQLANVAINQAKTLATNLKFQAQGHGMSEFEYADKGSMATVGKHKAVVDLPFWKFKGYFAWFLWMFLHLMLILSVKNKLIIFINWAYNYITRDSSLRLILDNKDE